MPSKDEHLEKASHNEKLAEVLLNTAFSDWAVTLFFYSALHYTDAVLAVWGQHPPSHEARDPMIKQNKVLRRIWHEYKSLDVMSRNARYYAMRIDNEHLKTVRENFDILRSYIRKELGLD